MANDKTLRAAREYLSWAVKTESELRKEGLWTVVSAGAPPATPVGSASVTTLTVPLRDTFDERDSRALGLIRCRLSTRLITKYDAYKTSKALWDALKVDFSTTNKTELAFAALNSLHQVRLSLPGVQRMCPSPRWRNTSIALPACSTLSTS
ncbi:hypothetical protein B0H13DRAFT_1897803 [Mycena leptocephala]|nr:hypothetical protein B0H13DRAFT_1897803 [Mycena leptocephala]